jgi:hypothetical protein
MLDINNTILNQNNFFKIRSQVFEFLSMIWLDDYNDNYIEAIIYLH